MFLEELMPIYEEISKQPIAFMGGVVAGFLKLKLDEEPLDSWLKTQKDSQ